MQGLCVLSLALSLIAALMLLSSSLAAVPFCNVLSTAECVWLVSGVRCFNNDCGEKSQCVWSTETERTSSPLSKQRLGEAAVDRQHWHHWQENHPDTGTALTADCCYWDPMDNKMMEGAGMCWIWLQVIWLGFWGSAVRPPSQWKTMLHHEAAVKVSRPNVCYACVTDVWRNYWFDWKHQRHEGLHWVNEKCVFVSDKNAKWWMFAQFRFNEKCDYVQGNTELWK